MIVRPVMVMNVSDIYNSIIILININILLIFQAIKITYIFDSFRFFYIILI
jgi:hypothetical protein